MTKKEDQDALEEIKIELAVERNNRKWIHTVCRTSTIACGSVLFWLGTIVYDKFPAVKAAVMAFLKADKGIE